MNKNKIMTEDLANEITGGFSKPSKMPCPSYNIPAARCKTGGKLREVPGSTCEICYCFNRGNYRFPNVKNAMERRFQNLKHPRWVEAMAFLIKCGGNMFFRWHDSGDIQNVAHLRRIVEVCRLTPNVSHWLPTRELGTVSEYLKSGGTFPGNLTVRLSAFMVDAPPSLPLAQRLGVTCSTVTTSPETAPGFICPSSKQGNKCLDCRECWNKKTANVAYIAH